MNIIISNSSAVPIYEQVVNQIKNNILGKELKEGEALPSVRSLANDLKISFLTVKKAYDILEKNGFIKTVQGKGSFVMQINPDLAKEESLVKIQQHIEEVIKIANSSGIEEEEILKLLKILYKEEE